MPKFDASLESMVREYEIAREDAIRAKGDAFAFASAAATVADRRLHAAIKGLPDNSYFASNGYRYSREGDDLTRVSILRYPADVVEVAGGVVTMKSRGSAPRAKEPVRAR